MRLLLIVLFSPIITFSQQTKEVLFVGNSYTFYNNLPQLVSDIAISLGDTLIHDSSTPGGATFNAHSSNSQTLSKISQQQWDYVVLQAQSQEPSFPPGQVANDTYPYAAILVDSIESNFSCIEPMFFMTWGRKYGDQTNCVVYPPVCTYSGMQQRLRESYLEMSVNHNASCSPVGMAWKASIELDSALNLYSPDNSHPSIYGSYLAACTFYSSLFKKPSLGSSFYGGIDSITAISLQTIASSTVLDSIANWNIFNTDFTVNQNNDSISCINLSSNYENLIWDFGDGAISIDENPTHIYSGSGIYTITLTAFNNDGCLSDTISSTITISAPANINELSSTKKLLNITDVLGKETTMKLNTPLFYKYDDGTVERRITIE
jgi:hypothetical protein